MLAHHPEHALDHPQVAVVVLQVRHESGADALTFAIVKEAEEVST